MKAIIFGANGQDGYYLTKLLQQNHIDVIAINRPTSSNDVNITDFDSVSRIIKSTRPLFIFHLAANSTTRHDAIFENEKIISLGTINILEAVRLHSPDSKVFISGSGLQFENIGVAISETDLFAARDPYSVSRIHSTYAARYYRRLGLKIYVGYFFNHDSPRRTQRHLAKKITQYVSDLRHNDQNRLLIGNIDVVKEWTYAGDIVEAVYTLVNQDIVFEAVIGSGKGYSIKEFLEISFSLIGKNWRDFVSIEQGYVPEYSSLVSNPALIFSLGWQPKVSIHNLAEMMIKDIQE